MKCQQLIRMPYINTMKAKEVAVFKFNVFEPKTRLLCIFTTYYFYSLESQNCNVPNYKHRTQHTKKEYNLQCLSRHIYAWKLCMCMYISHRLGVKIFCLCLSVQVYTHRFTFEYLCVICMYRHFLKAVN